MKAISLWQPWASAIAAGVKTIETRSWPTQYRGPLAIHAAKRWTNAELYSWADLVLKKPEVMRAFERIGIFGSRKLPLGCIVATCEIYDCLITSGPPPENHLVSPFERDWGNYAEGRFAWLLRNVKPITPVPCVGRQGFFEWEDNAPS